MSRTLLCCAWLAGAFDTWIAQVADPITGDVKRVDTGSSGQSKPGRKKKRAKG
jgi:hypothetical protein